MSGMLMSIRTTSGCMSPAIEMASVPDAADPTTSMSLSKPRSLVRWSRVSGMSSTIRTRIWSAIRQWVRWSRSRGGWGRCPGALDGRGTGGPTRPSRWLGDGRPGRPGGGLSARRAPLSRKDALDELRDRDPEVVDELLQRCALRRVGWGQGDRARDRVDREVLAGSEDEADRAVQLGELDDFGLVRVDPEDHDLLLAVEGGARIGGLAARLRLAVLGRSRRRELAAQDLHPLEEQLHARAARQGRDGVVRHVGVDQRELVAGEADEHVHVVA